MPRSLLALSLIFYSFHASAFFTASADKPDPYARRHYTAADLPAAKRKLAAQKAALAKKSATPAAKTRTPTDAEIMAEIEREDSGTEAGIKAPSAPKVVSRKITNPEPSVALKVVNTPAPIRAENRHAGPSSDDMDAAAKIASYRRAAKAVDEFETPAIAAPKNGYPSVVVCRFSFPKKRASIASRYLISDSDGFEACSQHGGEVTAGNEDDRTLMNVKDSAILKRAKK